MAGSGTLMLNVPGVKLPPLGADGSAVSILNVKIIATGVVDPPTASLIEQMQDYYDSLSPMDLMLILATCWQCLFATLQDPETGMYTTLFLLPTMALVLRALRKQR